MLPLPYFWLSTWIALLILGMCLIISGLMGDVVCVICYYCKPTGLERMHIDHTDFLDSFTVFEFVVVQSWTEPLA